MTRMSSETFCEKFIPMARDGKSALEIGQALGVEGEPTKIAQFVSVRSSQIRTRLRNAATEQAVRNKMNAKETAKLVESVTAKIPKLKGSGRTSQIGELSQFIDKLIDKLDNPTPAKPTPKTKAK